MKNLGGGGDDQLSAVLVFCPCLSEEGQIELEYSLGTLTPASRAVRRLHLTDKVCIELTCRIKNLRTVKPESQSPPRVFVHA